MHYDANAAGRVIRKMRTQKHMTQELLSGFAGIARSHLSMIESGTKQANMETLWRIAQALEITPTYFSAFFMRQMGMGFNEYVTGQRIELAKQLLSATNKKINQIAAECGFRSASYFIVVFRKQVGISPGEFRDKKMQ